MARKSIPGTGNSRIRSEGVGRDIRLLNRIKDPNLSDTHPYLEDEWGQNGPWTPEHVTYGSGFIATWQCPNCKGSWRSRVQTRTNGSTCPFCSGRELSLYNSIKAVHPQAAAEFDLQNNDGVRPEEVISTHTKERHWYRCLEHPSHPPYRRTPYARTQLNKGCPLCFKEKAMFANRPNSLASTHPFVAQQWHATLNGGLTAHDVTAGSHQRAYFDCEYGHVAHLRICDKVRRPNCSDCINEVGREIADFHNRPAWKTARVSKRAMLKQKRKEKSGKSDRKKNNEKMKKLAPE